MVGFESDTIKKLVPVGGRLTETVLEVKSKIRLSEPNIIRVYLPSHETGIAVLSR